MPNWIRHIMALIAGSFAGGAIIALVETIGHKIVAGDTIFIVAAIGLGIGGFVGGGVAAWIGKSGKLAWGIALLLAALTLMNVFSFQHPIWYVPVAFILLILGTSLAHGVLKNRSHAA